jgi:hypothetical protein
MDAGAPLFHGRWFTMRGFLPGNRMEPGMLWSVLLNNLERVLKHDVFL